MAKPYSDDLRTRVAAAIAGGESCRAIAERFGIAPSTVVKWSKRVRETGSPAPGKFGGHRTCSLDPHRAFVLEQIDEVPHLTLHRLKDLLAQVSRCLTIPSGASCAAQVASPDLNPIEQVFAKVKHWMRMAQARSMEEIHDRIAKLVRSISQAECANYLRNAGYASI